MAQAPQTLSQAMALKTSEDTLFYGNPSFDTYAADRMGELYNLQVARKSALSDDTYNYVDVIKTAPYETDIAFEPTDKKGESQGMFFPNALERFLQLDFLDNVLDPSNQSPQIQARREQLKSEGYVDQDGNLDVAKLQTLHNPEQYRLFLKYAKDNFDLEGLEYERRERPKPVRVSPGPTVGVLPSDVLGGMFDLNEEQRARAAGRGASPDVNYMSILEQNNVTLPNSNRTAIGDLSTGRQVSPRSLNVKELENLLRRFDPSAQVAPMDFDDPENGQFRIISDLTGGRPVPFGDIQPLESLSEGDPSAFLEEAEVIFGQEGPAAVLGGGLIALLRKGIQKRAQERIERNVAKIEKGESGLETTGFTGKMLGLAAASGTGEALGEAMRLYYGKESGYQPDMSDIRIWEQSGLAGIYALGGEFAGELLIKGFGRVKSMMTGERLPESLIDRLRAAGEMIKRKRKRTLGDLPEGEPEINQAAMTDFIMESGGELGKELNALTVGDLSRDKLLQSLENNLLGVMNRETIGFDALDGVLRNQSDLLTRYYEAINARLSPDKKITREDFNDLVNTIKFENLSKRKAAAEEDVFNIERQLDIEDRINQPRLQGEEGPLNLPDYLARAGLPQDAGPISDVATEIQQIVKGGRPSYPQYSSEIMTLYRQVSEPIRKRLDGVLNKTVKDFEGNDFQVYQEPVVTLPKFIGKQLNNMLNANRPEDRIFGTADDLEVAEIIRTMLQNRADEGISIQQLADPDLFEKQRRFSIAELTSTIQNLESMFKVHPNQNVREEGKKLIDALADARSEAYRIQYKKITGSKSAPTELKAAEKYERDVLSTVGEDINRVSRDIEVEQGKLDGQYIYQIATKEPTELGSYVLNSKPSKLDSLIRVLSQTPEGLQKLHQIRLVVFDALEKQIGSGGVGTVQQAKRLADLSSRNSEQLQRLFPGVDFNPKAFQRIRNDLQNAQNQLSRINNEIEGMVNPETGELAQTPVEVLDAYFNLSPNQKRDFRGTETHNKLKNLSNIADQYPDLRAAFLSDFQRRIRNLSGIDSDIAIPQDMMRRASTREKSEFDLNELSNLVLYSNSTKELTEDLALIVGKDAAPEFAKNLRNFARKLRFLAAKEETRKEAPGESLRSIMEHMGGTVSRIRKAYFGVLSRAGYTSNLILEELGPRVANHLAIILSNPAKLDEFIKIYDKKRMPVGDVARVLAQIALGREGAEDTEESEVEQFRRKVADEFDLPRIERMFPSLDSL